MKIKSFPHSMNGVLEATINPKGMGNLKKMYKDLTNGKLAETIEFAKSIGLENSLIGCLERISRHGSESREVLIGGDFAPYSFTFAVKDRKTNALILNGGIIFHGRHDGFGSGSAPTYSVSLEREIGWQVHT